MKDYIESRFGASLEGIDVVQPIYHASGFQLPDIPCILDSEPERVRYVKWGLIPHWVKDAQQADMIRFQTLNARSETIFEKPSFRGPIRRSRCLVLVDGFFEFRDVRAKKFPYLIRLKDGEAFALAGIWDTWGELRTFSVVTTRANPFMEMIHNTKKRMPLILPKDVERAWLDPNMDDVFLEELMAPFDESFMEAHPVSRDLARRDLDTNVPEILVERSYPELELSSLDTFF